MEDTGETLPMRKIDQEFDRLIRKEKLDDIGALLVPREWDEVPLVSRVQRIDFLGELDAKEKSRLLLIRAVGHLRRILAFAEEHKRKDLVVMISIADWGNLDADEPEPVIPNFWICTHPARDLVQFRLKPGASENARRAIEWLGSADLLDGHEVLENVVLEEDPDLRRVYVVERASPGVESLVVR